MGIVIFDNKGVELLENMFFFAKIAYTVKKILLMPNIYINI